MYCSCDSEEKLIADGYIRELCEVQGRKSDENKKIYIYFYCEILLANITYIVKTKKYKVIFLTF